MLVLPAMASHEQKVAEHVRGIQQFLATQKGLLDKSKWGAWMIWGLLDI